ncbi:uncharacterized protein LOC143267791 isoform X2 [Peromyscus maniculatus bairdii]|uniref:uncharacterized protein LOC143267791 isoform X2 n=1 Tax=Peromyscus maniculatus bairdii TaxID=230844 RepID=UPI003FD5A3D7
MAVAAAGAGAPRASSSPRGRGAVAGARGGAGGARGGAGDQPPWSAAAPGAAGRDPGGGEPAAAAPHSLSLGGAVDSAMGGRAAQSAAAAQADTGCGRGTQAGPGMGSARDRPLAGDPQRCATTGSGPIWGR